MMKSDFFWLVLLGLTVIRLQDAAAGSAVAFAAPGHLVSEYGHPRSVSIRRALEEAHRRYGANVKIIASSDVTGYGAIAVARHPNGHDAVIGIALGKRSQTEAVTMAIEHCRKAGGTNAQVRWAFRG